MTDLSSVPVCPMCGLEIADLSAHQTWHDYDKQWRASISAELSKLFSLLRDQQAYELRGPINPKYVSANPEKLLWEK